MKITFLVNNLSENGMYRTLSLARLLKRFYAVEVVGPRFGKSIYNPFVEENFDFKEFPGCNFPEFGSVIKNVIRCISGDIIYAHHPIFTSFGIGLMSKLKKKRPIVIDIDDWPMGHWLESYSCNFSLLVRRVKNLTRLLDPTSAFYTLPTSIILSKFADKITVTSRFLQKQFGGVLIPQFQDLDLFDPLKYNRQILRNKYGFKDEKLILFLGTPNPYKGVEDIISAVKRINRGVKILMVGARQSDYVDRLKNLGRESLITVDSCSYSQVPEYLSLSDLVVIPQKLTPITTAQIPAKLIDAMAMAKPIIVSKVSDMPSIMNDCGLTYASGDIEDLSKKIGLLLGDPVYSSKLGLLARAKCFKEFNYDVVGLKLKEVFDSLCLA